MNEFKPLECRIELDKNGNYILCGQFLPNDMITVGQNWTGVSGGVVTVESIVNDVVTYSWLDGDTIKYHEKESFAFQCRYCLIVGFKHELLNEQTV